MMLSLLLAVGLGPAAPVARPAPGPAEVTAVSVMPGPGRAQVVIDVAGGVTVQDFTLRNPDRLVIDLVGASLAAPYVQYDGKNRGGILDVRYAQFRPDVVRVVLELERLTDYQVDYANGAVTVSLGTDRSFAAWSSGDGSWAKNLAQFAEASAAAAAPPAASAPPAQQAQSQQPPLTASWDNAPISDVIAGFAAFSGKTIIVGKSVTGTVTATVKNQPWDIAFHQILQAQALAAFEEFPGIIRVDDQAALAKLDSIEPLQTTIQRINYARAASLVPALDAIKSSRGKIVADTATNSLIITDVVSRIGNYSDFLSQLDVRTPQVSIQTRLVFVNRTELENLGIKYDLGSPTQFFNRLVQRGDPASAQPVDTDGDGVPDAVRPTEQFDADEVLVDLGGNSLSALANADAGVAGAALRLIFSTAIGNFNLTSFLEALETVELSDLQAEPVISTADNTQAYILVGERTPIRVVDVSSPTTGAAVTRATVDYQQTGILLRVTPHVTANRQVLMRLRAENSSVVAAPRDIGFTFQTQEAENQILVNDGETAVIGGLTVTQVTVSKSGIPFLVDLPILGRIFGFTSRREIRRDLLVLVTPHIVDDLPGASPPDRL
ncbi:MAG: AMIN domain-containing protein [Gemmatimonadetes bacterium]|nr:AMIN domain-containing protein [Gemmatimonadota bacterium]